MHWRLRREVHQADGEGGATVPGSPAAKGQGRASGSDRGRITTLILKVNFTFLSSATAVVLFSPPFSPPAGGGGSGHSACKIRSFSCSSFLGLLIAFYGALDFARYGRGGNFASAFFLARALGRNMLSRPQQQHSRKYDWLESFNSGGDENSIIECSAPTANCRQTSASTPGFLFVPKESGIIGLLKLLVKALPESLP